jgi:hypothetical protein
MCHRWKVELTAGNYYPDLTVHFDRNDLVLDYDDDPETSLQFHLFSDHLDGIEEIEAVLPRVAAFELLLNGSLRLVYDHYIYFSAPIRFTYLVEMETGQRFPLRHVLPEDDPFNHQMENPPCVHAAAKLIALSRADEGLRTLLFLVGMLSWPGHSDERYAWGNLYKVYETASTLAREKNLKPFVNVSEADITSFRAAVNNMSVLGLSARHGLTGLTAPKRVNVDLIKATKDVMAMARTVAC